MKKWFTIATEGQTTDGRAIERSWLEDIAATYSRDKYGARIWLEHIRGIVPDNAFQAYGDVLAVRTNKNKEGKLELQAQIDPTPELISLSKKRQKIYTSIEIAPNFAKTGKCGLVGLGITDSPASLGTSILEFSAQHPEDNPFSSRKQSPDNLFSSTLETALDFSEMPIDLGSEASLTFFSRLSEMFRTMTQQQTVAQTAQQPTQQPASAEIESAMQAFSAFQKAYQEGQASIAARLDQFAADINEFKTATAKDVNELRALLDQTPGQFTQRPAATGAKAETYLTDC